MLHDSLAASAPEGKGKPAARISFAGNAARTTPTNKENKSSFNVPASFHG
jgi:hypothetical protein